MFSAGIAGLVLISGIAAADDGVLRERVEAALRRALAAMGTRQWSGGWATAWTEDGRVTWGEFKPIKPHMFTVQPPATPSVARVYVRAARVFEDPGFLQNALLARDALLRVQSAAGGFPQDADPQKGKANAGSFDDETTTGALDFFLDLWFYTGDEVDRRAVESVAEFLLDAQYPDSGGWPQWYPPSPTGYNRYITFNDGVMTDIIRSLLRLHEVFGDARYLDAAKRGGDCIIALQGGEGEAIWAQQYDPGMGQPARARVFEPAGYSAAESRGICGALLDVFLATGEERYLEPLPHAFAWYESSRLPNGKWARLYEPGTRRPIYGGSRAEYKPVYSIEEAVDGYSWEGDYFPASAKALYERVLREGREAVIADLEKTREPAPSSGRVMDVCDALSPSGWWLGKPSAQYRADLAEAGAPDTDVNIIHSGTFCRNAALLLDFLERADENSAAGS